MSSYTGVQHSRVLVIEDNPLQLQTLVALLSEDDLTAVGCPTGAEALALFQQEEFSVVVMDLRLADMEGLQLLTQMNARSRRTRVIIHTGYGSFTSAKEAINLGAFAYVEKAGDPAELLRHVHSACRAYLDHYATDLEVAVEERTASLRESEERFRQLAEAINDVFWLQDAKTQQVVYVSPQYASLWGRSCESLYAQPDTWFEAVHPEDRAAVHQIARPPQCFGQYDITYRIIRPDGSLRWIHDRAFPVHDASGKVQRIAGVATDITDHKLAEETLRQSEIQFRTLAEASPQGIMIHRRFVPLFVNQACAHIFGYSHPEEILSLPSILSLVAPHEHERLMLQSEACLRGEVGAIQCEYQGRRRDGTIIWLHDQQTRTIWEGEPAVQATLLDLTQRERTEGQIRQAQKMQAIGTLAGGIAHDFNNILAAILGYAELTLHDIPPNTLPWNNLQRILAAGHRAKELVRQILTFSRQTGQARQPVELQALIQEVLQLLRATLPTTIEIRQQLTAEPSTVLVDATQVHQVLMNLAANAEYAMRPHGGILEICLDIVQLRENEVAHHPDLPPGSYLRLMMRDTGCGMTQEVRERIFEPFFTTKGVGEGTGMGLAVVHGIITDHGGTITVASQPGQGTTFTILLPRYAATSLAAVAPAPLSGRGHERLLFVDDEATLARLGEMLLSRLGYKVISCMSGKEALDIFQHNPQNFDLVITDQTMPGMTGDILTQELRKIRPDIPVILCTGFSHTMTPEHARALGVDAFFVKPLVAQELHEVIRNVLAHTSPHSNRT